VNLFVDPQAYNGAMSREGAEAWLEAMVKEIDIIERMRTWRLVPRPSKYYLICG
jgi:hypothetical protein